MQTETETVTLQGEAERLLSYWERHGDNPEAVSKWAVSDLLGFLRYIVEAGNEWPAQGVAAGVA